jgi:lactobin A/cerein 7B family class IIb bacteriocin
MNYHEKSLYKLNEDELHEINGGGWGIVVAVYSATLACAYYVGYYEGKEECEPKPCEK